MFQHRQKYLKGYWLVLAKSATKQIHKFYIMLVQFMFYHEP